MQFEPTLANVRGFVSIQNLKNEAFPGFVRETTVTRAKFYKLLWDLIRSVSAAKSYSLAKTFFPGISLYTLTTLTILTKIKNVREKWCQGCILYSDDALTDRVDWRGLPSTPNPARVSPEPSGGRV